MWFSKTIYVRLPEGIYSKLLVIEWLMSTRIFQLSVRWVTKPKNHGWEKHPTVTHFIFGSWSARVCMIYIYMVMLYLYIYIYKLYIYITYIYIIYIYIYIIYIYIYHLYIYIFLFIIHTYTYLYIYIDITYIHLFFYLFYIYIYIYIIYIYMVTTPFIERILTAVRSYKGAQLSLKRHIELFSTRLSCAKFC